MHTLQTWASPPAWHLLVENKKRVSVPGTDANGEIRVDGVNTRLLSLRELRQALTIIPQDPVIFTGKSLRKNLDPLEEYSEEKLYDALRCCKLDDFVRRHGGKILKREPEQFR